MTAAGRPPRLPAMALTWSLPLAPAMLGATVGFTVGHPYVPLGAATEAGCWKPAEATSAHAFTRCRAGHPRVPPGLQTGD
jgi:hypothetical protein